MSLSNRQRAEGAVAYGMVRGMTQGEVVDLLDGDGLLAPDPQIIRTREELEALDPDTVVWPYGYHDPYAAGRLLTVLDGPFNDPEETVIPLPIAVIREGAEVRAARKALEEA